MGPCQQSGLQGELEHAVVVESLGPRTNRPRKKSSSRKSKHISLQSYGGTTTNPHCYHFAERTLTLYHTNQILLQTFRFCRFRILAVKSMTSNSGAVLPRLILFIFNMYLITTSGQK